MSELAFATISNPCYLRNSGYLFLTETVCSMYLFRLWSDGLWFGRLQDQLSLPFWYFCAQQETAIKQFPCFMDKVWEGKSDSKRLWPLCSFHKHGVKNVLPECDQCIAVSKHKRDPLENVSFLYSNDPQRRVIIFYYCSLFTLCKY